MSRNIEKGDSISHSCIARQYCISGIVNLALCSDCLLLRDPKKSGQIIIDQGFASDRKPPRDRHLPGEVRR